MPKRIFCGQEHIIKAAWAVEDPPMVCSFSKKELHFASLTESSVPRIAKPLTFNLEVNNPV